MTTSIPLGIVLGLIVGAGFAWLQLLALRRNELLEQQRELPGLLKMLPGTMGRVAFLLMALVLVQVVWPGVNIWSVSGGLVIAYAALFISRLRAKYCATHS